MGSFGMKVEGVNSVLSSLDDAVRDDRVPEALRRGAEVMLAEMQHRAPVVTGELKASLQIKERGRAVEVGSIKTEEPWAAYIEYGHGGKHPAGPHPFLKPAAEAAEAAAFEAIEKYLMEGM